MSTVKNYEEVELRAFNIDSPAVRTKLNELGAIALHEGPITQQRAVFDVVPPQPTKWIRLRNDGTQTTLAFKERRSDGFDKEVEVVVSDFDETIELLAAAFGMTPRSKQTNRREAFEYNGADVTIDSWPGLNDLLEIEGRDMQHITTIATELGIDAQQLTSRSVEQEYLDVLGIDVKVTNLDFDAS